MDWDLSDWGDMSSWTNDLTSNMPNFGDTGDWNLSDWSDILGISGTTSGTSSGMDWGKILGMGTAGLGIAKDIYGIYNNMSGKDAAGKYGDFALSQMGMNQELGRLYLANMLQTQPLRDAQYGIESKRLGYEAELSGDYGEGKKSLIRKLLEGEDVTKARYMDQASADVASSFAKQRSQDTMRMGMMGMDPNTGASAGYQTKMGISQALADASARTMAGRQAEDTALSRQAQAVNFSQGTPLPQFQYNSGSNIQGALYGKQQADQNAQDAYTGLGYGINKLFGGV